MDHAADAVAERGHVEIEEKTYRKAEELEVSQRLRQMHVMQRLHRLDLNQDRLVDNKIEAKRWSDGSPLVEDWYGALRLDLAAPELELVAKAVPIDAF